MYDMRDTLSYYFSGVTAKENYGWGLKEQKMISNQILQNTIEGLKGIARVELCVMDVDGKEVAATMDIARLSMSMASGRLQTDVGMAVLGKAMDTQEAQGQAVVELIDSAAMERSVTPQLGANIDLRI